MKLDKKKFLWVMLASFVVDLLSHAYTYAVVHDWIFIQFFLALPIPILGMLYSCILVDAETWRERTEIALVGGISLAASSTLLLLFINH